PSGYGAEDPDVAPPPAWPENQPGVLSARGSTLSTHQPRRRGPQCQRRHWRDAMAFGLFLGPRCGLLTHVRAKNNRASFPPSKYHGMLPVTKQLFPHCSRLVSPFPEDEGRQVLMPYTPTLYPAHSA